MTECPNGEMRDRLPDLLHDRLSGAERVAVEAHVASCAECRAELALLGRLRASMRRAPAVDVGAVVGALPAYRAPARRGTVGGWRAAAAIAALTVGGGTLLVARQQAGRSAAPVVVSRQPSVVERPAPVTEVAPAQRPAAAQGAPGAQRVAQSASRHELAVGGAVTDLSDRELAAVLDDLESLDALPSASVDVESPSLAPAQAPAKEAS